jgi:hypothetical protein
MYVWVASPWRVRRVWKKVEPIIALLGTALVADGLLSRALRGAHKVTKPQLMVGRFVEDGFVEDDVTP